MANWQLWLLSAQAQERIYSVDSPSSITIFVGRAGVLSGLGHEHVVAVSLFSGEARIALDNPNRSFFRVEANADALSVVDKGISEKDRNEIQSAMESKVLEVSRFPKISFRSVSIANIKSSADGQTLTINGDLSLHGVTNRVAVPVTMVVTPDEVRVSGDVTIRQTDFGIKPYSAAGGTIKVKDALKINFAIIAKPSKGATR